jgi:hypothetical protein
MSLLDMVKRPLEEMNGEAPDPMVSLFVCTTSCLYIRCLGSFL